MADLLQEFSLTEREFQLFSELIRAQAGINLGEHKRQLLRARLAKRLRAHGFSTFGEYYDHLMHHDPDGEEMLRMVNCITTNKTEFFREPHHFDFLRDRWTPWVTAGARRDNTRKVRVWSAGCASGEEPYSIAIALREALTTALGWDVRILASDIDTEILGRAEKGIYPLEQVSAVPRALLGNYFLRGTGRFEGLVKVRKEIGDLVVFRRINLLDDPWPIRCRFDAIFCRNVMIYFDRATQRRLVERFASALVDGGYLFVGHSESLFGLSEELEFVQNTTYRKPEGERSWGAPKASMAG
jgi:chemotaxis protein methyltransferase CheR